MLSTDRGIKNIVHAAIAHTELAGDFLHELIGFKAKFIGEAMLTVEGVQVSLSKPMKLSTTPSPQVATAR